MHSRPRHDGGLTLSGTSVSLRLEEPSAPVLPATGPDVWEMPTRGIEWCDCGEHHDLDRASVLFFAESVARDPRWMTHEEVVDSVMDLWNYVAVCDFFLMAIEASALAVNGGQSPAYPFERGVEIVGHFSKIWQGCPEEICEAVRDRDS